MISEKAVEAVADAIDLARYHHPEYPRPRPRLFSEADSSDREYAMRLAHAAIAALSLQNDPQSENFARIRAENERLREALRVIQRTTFSGSEMGDEYVRGNRNAHSVCAGMARSALAEPVIIAEKPSPERE